MDERRWLVALIALVVLAAACGNGVDEAEEAVDDEVAPGIAPGSANLDLQAFLAVDLNACEPEPTGEPLRIGYAADLSEVGGFVDVPGSEAAQFMADLINCAGGVNGHPVEVTVQDIQGDPEITQRAAQDLLGAGVHGILGPPFADFGLPLLQVTNAEIPVLFVSSTEPILPDTDQLSFLVTFDDTVQATAAAQFAVEQGFETAVTFSSPGPYFGYNPEVFTAKFEELGGEVVADYTYAAFETTEFSTQVNELAGLPETPDVLYTAMPMDQIATLLGQIGGVGAELEVIGTDAFDATRIIDAGDLAESVYYTTHAFPSEGSPMKTFLDRFEQEMGRPLETVSFGALAADAVLLLADAFVRSGEQLDPLAIGEALKSAQSVEVITGTVTYAGTTGIPEKPVYVHQIVGGDISLAKSFEPGAVET